MANEPVRDLIRHYPFPKRLKRRPDRFWTEKAIYWQSAITENVAWFAGEYLKFPAGANPSHNTPTHTIRRTGRMLRILDLCLVGLACGEVPQPAATIRATRSQPQRRRDVH